MSSFCPALGSVLREKSKSLLQLRLCLHLSIGHSSAGASLKHEKYKDIHLLFHFLLLVNWSSRWSNVVVGAQRTIFIIDVFVVRSIKIVVVVNILHKEKKNGKKQQEIAKINKTCYRHEWQVEFQDSATQIGTGSVVLTISIFGTRFGTAVILAFFYLSLFTL